ncbi:MAG: cardiolipin synthase [Desulfohalobiaceae bacterium]|nr:cardiolipin synthase [Desulfohalobiaceae bacterium]
MFNFLLLFFILVAQITSAAHALLYKRDPKAAWAWIVTCLLFPPIGPILYILLGINRVRTKAQRLKWYWPMFRPGSDSPFHYARDNNSVLQDARNILCKYIIPPHFHPIAYISEAVTQRPLLGHNHIQALHNGEQAYPAMLSAIRGAKHRIYLATYILATDKTGREIIEALASAVERGVEVKVLVDAVGEFYSLPRAHKLLRHKGIPYARFLPVKLTSPSPFINLRNHRKLLIVDGSTGFTGGMNIRDKHLTRDPENPHPAQDLHFRLYGSIVSQLEEIFLEDWGFATGEHRQGLTAEVEGKGRSICRTVTVGPNQDLNKLGLILSGASSQASKSINIMTPYFLPPRELIGALQSAALRGVEVNVVLPAQNNLPFVHWATRNMLWELLAYGVHVYYQPPPFAHTKLFVLDDFYTVLGSANLDPRSLRLNFEVVLEVYEEGFGREMSDHIRASIASSRMVTLKEVDSRPLPERFRDSLCWLFSPYF